MPGRGYPTVRVSQELLYGFDIFPVHREQCAKGMTNHRIHPGPVPDQPLEDYVSGIKRKYTCIRRTETESVGCGDWVVRVWGNGTWFGR
jgi:hypothetical protein